MNVLSRLWTIAAERRNELVSGVSRKQNATEAVADLAAQLKDVEAAVVLIFASPHFDKDKLAGALSESFGATPVIGCTTAGEITPLGYETGTLTGVAFPRLHFRFSSRLLTNLSRFSIDDGLRFCREFVSDFGETPGWSSLAILLTDGMCRQEEALLSAFEPGLAPIPILGGSAGDGLDFQQTFVLHDGKFHSDAALLTLLATNYRFTELRFDHFLPTEKRMVVTEADPGRRLVREINAEPAAVEYARAVGCSVDELSPFVFATRPTLVRVGGKYHVRAIQKVEEDDGLSFLCAIDEGLVMTVGQAQDIVAHLDREFTNLKAKHGRPTLVLGFDCMLRRLESELLKKYNAVSELLRQNRVIGFSTYGEQYHGMHVNQTFVGVAFFDPDNEEETGGEVEK
ncbi:FIST N-terminal domain-containing protein [Hwanghaeella sp.]|uniref:FIST N-terminal domain-containing protein n=1 Tax=Hwanghaeella sp. TaxID=2605943 RepID=UPI003CCBA49D